MSTFGAKLLDILGLVVCGGLVGWVLYRWLKRSDDPARLISQWVITAVMVVITWWIAASKIAASAGGLDYATAFVVVISCAICGIVLGITWGSNIGGFFGRQLGSLYDGGDVEVVPTPFYSIAEAKRKQGKYREAVAEIQKQLAKFPGDFPGRLMLAEIQAENLDDLAGAHMTIVRLLGEPNQSPMNLALALNRLADWHLKYGRDPNSAREALERILWMFPETEQAYLASQRIAHLTTPEMLAEKSEPRRIELGQYQQNLGLLDRSSLVKPPAEDPAAVASDLVKHLGQHPQDSEARETLAAIYAEHYQRLDLAAEQFEQLLAQPNLPARQAVHLLNTFADLHIKHAGDVTAASQVLQRIVDLFPRSAAAENAKKRMAYLQLELRSKKESKVLKLGSYEQNIGLKARSGLTD